MRHRRLHPDVAVVLLAALAVASLHALALLLAPDPVPLGDAPSRMGERVVVEGRVLDVRHGVAGRRLVVADEEARLPILAGKGEGPARGDLVRIEGLVAMDDDGPIVSARTIVVATPAASRPLSPRDLADAPHAYDGARVLVEGRVERGALEGDGARVTLTGAPAPSGGAWRVEGAFRYRPAHAAYVLEADAWTRPS